MMSHLPSPFFLLYYLQRSMMEHYYKEYIPKVIASLVCCISFVVYGASSATLGASLPTLSLLLQKKEDDLGIIFTARGIGYLMGTLISAGLMDNSTINLSKHTLTALSILINGICMFLIQSVLNFKILLCIFCVHGISFGGIDTFANCALPELWTTQVNPWMQTMHACFAIGALIGPALVGRYQFSTAFLSISMSSLLPLLGILCMNLFCAQNNIGKKDTEEQNENDLSIEAALNGDGDSSFGKELGGKRYRLVDNSDVEDDVSIAENESSDCKRSSDRNSIAAKCVLKADKSVPLFVKLIIFIFYFLYVGTESGFSGWISMYSLNMKITSNDSAAAYLCSYFWTGLTLGRLLAIPQSLCLSASAMIRFQLLISLAGSICFWYLPTASYLVTGIISFLFGFALSSIFPLMMIIVADYGFVMDPNTTTLFVIGATFGEAILPIAIGFAIASFGSESFPISILIAVVLLVVAYLLVHFISVYIPESAQCLRCQRIMGQVLGPLCDVATQTVIRGKAFCRWIQKERGGQRSVRFNPVLDICEFSKAGKDDDSRADVSYGMDDSMNDDNLSGIEMFSVSVLELEFGSPEANSEVGQVHIGSEFNRALSP